MPGRGAGRLYGGFDQGPIPAELVTVDNENFDGIFAGEDIENVQEALDFLDDNALTIGNFVGRTFNYTATGGENEFTLPASIASNGIIILAINGAMQNQLGGDFSVSGDTVTLDENLVAGDKVYGAFFSDS